MINRYYAMHNAGTGWLQGGWAVFDREHTDKQGDCLPIAVCNTRSSAFKIRDALNAQTS